MRVLLDENLPLALHRALQARSHASEHIIESGQRGMPDSQIRARLEAEQLLFLTQDTEFLELPAGGRGLVLVSRLRQSRPIAERVSVWLEALEELLTRDRLPGTFELTDEGELHRAG